MEERPVYDASVYSERMPSFTRDLYTAMRYDVSAAVEGNDLFVQSFVVPMWSWTSFVKESPPLLWRNSMIWERTYDTEGDRGVGG